MAANVRYRRFDEYDFALFEPTQSTAARKIAPAPKKAKAVRKPKLEIVEKPKKTYEQVKKEMTVTARQTVVAIGLATLFIVMIAMLLVGRFRGDELDREILSLNAQITAAESENVRLNMEIDSVISLKNVEEYAITNLGMVKMEGNQIEYIDLSGEDKIVLSGNKKLNSSNGSVISRVMEYMSK